MIEGSKDGIDLLPNTLRDTVPLLSRSDGAEGGREYGSDPQDRGLSAPLSHSDMHM